MKATGSWSGREEDEVADRSRSASDNLDEVEADAVVVGRALGKEGIGARGRRSQGQVSGTTEAPRAADTTAAGQ